MESDADLLKLFKDAVLDLTFPSEIDAPFEVKIWDKAKGKEITSSVILELTESKPDEFIEEIELERLFYTPTMEQDWHSEDDKIKVIRFRTLQEAILVNLRGVKVYRVGRININVHIVGMTALGSVLCITTHQLQT